MGVQMNGQMNCQMNGQYAGMMQADGSPGFVNAVPQIMVVQAPACGMQQMQGYNVPQIMPPMGGMQPMQQMVAMQFVGQGADFGNWGPNNPGAPATGDIPSKATSQDGVDCAGQTYGSKIIDEEDTEQRSSASPPHPDNTE